MELGEVEAGGPGRRCISQLWEDEALVNVGQLRWWYGEGFEAT